MILCDSLLMFFDFSISSIDTITSSFFDSNYRFTYFSPYMGSRSTYYSNSSYRANMGVYDTIAVTV
jgi:hypothetical protein